MHLLGYCNVTIRVNALVTRERAANTEENRLIEDFWYEEHQQFNELRIAVNLLSDGGSLLRLSQEILRIRVIGVLDHHHWHNCAQSDQPLVSLARVLSLHIVQRRNISVVQLLQGRRQALVIN